VAFFAPEFGCRLKRDCIAVSHGYYIAALVVVAKESA
jgi:hypothetical protein